MKRAILSLALMVFALFCVAQVRDWQWAMSYGSNYSTSFDSGASTVVDSGGNSGSNFAKDLALDAVGNIYFTGCYTGTAYFGGTTLNPFAERDLYIASMDVQGNWNWAIRAGGSGNDYGMGVSTDSSGNLFLSGCYSGSAGFGDASYTSTGSFDIFIAKYGYPAPVPPREPENIIISVLEGNVILNWDAVTHDTDNQPVTVNRYKIYHRSSPQGDFALLGESSATQYTHNGATSTDRSFYKVTAQVD